jgi:ABC-type sugar transport system ATPase subunit
MNFVSPAIFASLPETRRGRTEGFAIGMRPEHLTLCDPSQARLKGKLQHLEALGAETLLHLTLDNGEPLTIRHYGNVASPRAGEDCFVTCDDEDLCLFDPDGRCVVPAAPE